MTDSAQREAFTKACAETARALSAGVAAAEWGTVPSADLVAFAEAMEFRDVAARRYPIFLPDAPGAER